MAKKISYLSRDYNDYKNSLIEFSKTYYPDVANSFNDASVGAWLVDLNSIVADELSYHIDRTFQETNINSANNKSSLYALARNNGFKIPGPKGSMAEVEFSCTLPLLNTNGSKSPNWLYAPTLKVGTRVTSSNYSFELLRDINFGKQFNEDGVSDRTIEANRDSNGEVKNYTIRKRALVIASSTKIYKKYISSSEVKPFMEILIPDTDIMNVESIIMKEGSVFQSNPSDAEFAIPEETSTTYSNVTRFFEVDSLIEQERWDSQIQNGIPIVQEYGYVSGSSVFPSYSITRGEWKPLKHKFITEYTDSGYLNIVFGSGIDGANEIDLGNADTFAKNQITRMIESDCLGVLPKADHTIFIKYRSGGGEASNLAEGAINDIAYKNVEFTNGTSDTVKSAIISSLSVISVTPSVSGKDMPNVNELRNMIKYYKGSQDRCITVKDYINRIYMIPPKFGVPYRVSGVEANNKIMLYLLGVDYKGHLDASLPDALITNIIEYLQKFRSVNDYVEIMSGRIINLSFQVRILYNKDYNTSDISKQIREVIKDYMAINKHQMGDDIFVGDIERAISNIEGVENVVKVRVFNETGEGYSKSETTQEVVVYDNCTNSSVYKEGQAEIDLEASNKMLIADGESMFEVKYPEGNDINIEFIVR